MHYLEGQSAIAQHLGFDLTASPFLLSFNDVSIIWCVVAVLFFYEASVCPRSAFINNTVACCSQDAASSRLARVQLLPGAANSQRRSLRTRAAQRHSSIVFDVIVAGVA